MSFETNVFINCPFDDEYRTLLHPLLFTVIYCGLNPKISETESSGHIRIEKIKTLIRDSKYSIHDICHSVELKKGKKPRLNMPYELGLDIGCQTYGNKKLQTKKCLILDKEKHRYQAVISDIGGQDPKDHQDNPQILIRKLREWFVRISPGNNIKGPDRIWEDFTEFWSDITISLSNDGWSKNDIEQMAFSELIRLAKRWVTAKKYTLHAETGHLRLSGGKVTFRNSR